jgi:hypothetical protein
MRKFTIGLVAALLTFLLGIAATTVWIAKHSTVESLPHEQGLPSTGPGNLKARLAEPDYTWVPTYFEEIDGRVRIARLPTLRTATFSGNDLEARVWVGFGMTALEGFVLKRSGGQWSATHLDGISPRLPRSKYQVKLAAPKSGWEATWQRLVSAGLLTLPDASAIRCNPHMTDGIGYVVEYNVKGSYRTYRYTNPEYPKCGEAKQMMRIGEIIAEEFGAEEFRIQEVAP